jgi:hypothetical protein
MMPKKNKTNKSHSQHYVLDVVALSYKRESNLNVYIFLKYASNEHKGYCVSLRTRDSESAVKKGRNLVLELSSQVHRGMKVFGISLGELTEKYMKYQHNYILVGDIVVGRWITVLIFNRLVGKTT